MRPRIVLLVSFLFVFVVHLHATNPPNKGAFPRGFWKTALQDQTLLKYGDPGWVKRMEQRRLQQQVLAFAKTVRPLLPTDNFILPVLLGQYSDNAGNFSVQDFQNLLFDDNPTGTLTAYYNEISCGQFNLTGQVHGWFTSDQTRSYYASNNNGLNSSFPRNGAGFVRSIVGKADPSVNFSLYDNDGPDGIPNSGDDDGYADGVIVVYAGAGADWYPRNSNLWPHTGSLGNNEYTTNDAAANGGMIKVNAFAICPERAGSGSGLNQIRPIGVFTHEFGHILGLPDLYDRTDAGDAPDFQPSEGIGNWCLMAGGSWGGDGNHTETPAHMSAWCKIQMGWVAPTLVTENKNGVMIRQAENNAEAYMLWEDGYQMPWENGYQWNRYFLIENRQRTGFDEYLNGVGLLIFHIDENRRWGRIAWSGGPVNDDETRKLVDLEEADGNVDLDKSINRGDAGDPFPGTSNNGAFTDASNPNSRDYDGVSTGVEVKNISSPGATMTADLVARQPVGYALAYDENGITGSTWGFTTARNSWSGVRFTTQQAGILTVLDLGFLTPPNTYEIKVYSSFNGTQPSGLLTTVSGQATGNGWHTISIPGGVTLRSNQDFFVSVKITNKAYAHSYDRGGQASGRSYFSGDGITFSNSISTDPNGGDLNIRARILQRDSPTIIVTTPTEGTTWTVGSSQVVTWNSSGVSGNMNIKLSTNGGSTFPITLVPNTSNDGSESITVPNNISNMCRVRVESMSNTSVFGDNPGYFSIANLSVTITSNPSGRQIVVDGTTYTAPRTFTNWSVGSQHTIGLTSPQIGTSTTQYVFSSWSDGGEQTHTVTAPSTNTTYTANFTTQYQLTVNANPSAGGTTNPSGQSWRDSGVNVSISATPNSGYSFTGWSGSATGTNNPATVTMNAPKTVTANFATIIAAPTTPTLISPANGAQNQLTALTLSWNPATGATTYRLQVSRNPAFTTIIFDDSTNATTSRQVGPLTNNTAYYWRVKAKNIGGASAWSSVWSFTTIIAVPTAPTLISPANGAANQSTTLTLSWNPATGATTYRLQVSRNPAFTTIIFDDSTNATTSRQVGPLTNNTTHYWRMKAKNVGGSSAWSSVWSFTTGTTAVSERGKVTPTEFSLNQNYPNPFNPSTAILYALPKTVFVRLTVFNPLGKEVETLVGTTQVAGEYKIHWNPKNLANGVYLYRLQAGSFIETKKLVLMR